MRVVCSIFVLVLNYIILQIFTVGLIAAWYAVCAQFENCHISMANQKIE